MSQRLLASGNEAIAYAAEYGTAPESVVINGINGMNISGRIKGTDIILSVDRSLQLQGKQLLTWG